MKPSGLAQTTHVVKTGRCIIHLLFALLVSSACFTSRMSAQTPAAAPPPQQREDDTISATLDAPQGRSTLRGRVLYEDTGRPVGEATISVVRMTRPHQIYGTTTNERGEFSVENLPAGKYAVTADAAEILVQGMLLPTAESTPQRPIVELDGKSSLEVQVRARRGGAITGQVMRADGSPAVDARIMLMVKRDGHIRPYKQSDVRTDKQGFYRFGGLPNGDYLVSADDAYAEPAEGETPRDTSYGTLVGTLYPSTTRLTEATTVSVKDGLETANINITIVKRSTYKVSGRIRTLRGGLPHGEASISIREKDETFDLSTFEQTKPVDAQGRFWFDGVPDGTYVLNVIPSGKAPSDYVGSVDTAQLRDELVYPFLYKKQEVTVAGADLKELVIELSEGASINGTVEMENGQPLPADMSISVQANFFGSTAARIRPDRSFRLQGIPTGNVYPYVYTTVFNNTSMKVTYDEYYVKAIYLGGIDLRGEPLKVEEGEEVKGVRLLLSREVATVVGSVRSAKDGAPQRGINVVLLPTDPARQRIGKGLSFGFTDAKGAFCASGPPGEYFVVAFGDSDLPVTDEKIKALAANAPRVRLQPNERKTVDLTRAANK